MATPDVFFTSPLLDYRKGGENAKPREQSIEKKIEFLENLAGNVSNRRSRRWLNDRLLMELVPRLSEKEIRGLFAPPPFGDDVPQSPFCMTNMGEWDKFRTIDMDKEAKIMRSMNRSPSKKRGQVDTEKMAVLNSWHRIDCRTREALRRSFLVELVQGYEDCVRGFINDSEDVDVLVLQIQDPFHRLLLHGVCEYYNLGSITVSESEDGESLKTTKITKKNVTSAELPNICLAQFLKMSKEDSKTSSLVHILSNSSFSIKGPASTIQGEILGSSFTLCMLKVCQSLSFLNSLLFMAKKLVQYYVVDAFTDSAFKGNPAAVCLLEEDKDDAWLQSVAAEFNISETCYLTRVVVNDNSPNPRFKLRWFTPVDEVVLCGHATLAAAHTLFTKGLVDSNLIEFSTLSGILTAKRVQTSNLANPSNIQNAERQDSFLIELDFPVLSTVEFNSVEVSTVSQALGGVPIIEMKKTTTSDYLLVMLPSGKHVLDLQPEMNAALSSIPDVKGIIVTGVAPPETGFDFYSRFFAPKLGVDEDPVTGSAHCVLAPFWQERLGKCEFNAYQASRRGGTLNVHLDEKSQRVLLRGNAVTVMEGSLLA
ncbi:hypothetical protein ACFE04_032001 [Oxalis oulophora]